MKNKKDSKVGWVMGGFKLLRTRSLAHRLTITLSIASQVRCSRFALVSLNIEPSMARVLSS